MSYPSEEYNSLDIDEGYQPNMDRLPFRDEGDAADVREPLSQVGNQCRGCSYKARPPHGAGNSAGPPRVIEGGRELLDISTPVSSQQGRREESDCQRENRPRPEDGFASPLCPDAQTPNASQVPEIAPEQPWMPSSANASCVDQRGGDDECCPCFSEDARTSDRSYPKWGSVRDDSVGSTSRTSHRRSRHMEASARNLFVDSSDNVVQQLAHLVRCQGEMISGLAGAVDHVLASLPPLRRELIALRKKAHAKEKPEVPDGTRISAANLTKCWAIVECKPFNAMNLNQFMEKWMRQIGRRRSFREGDRLFPALLPGGLHANGRHQTICLSSKWELWQKTGAKRPPRTPG